MKMCDFKIIKKALKTDWVKRIQDESQASWKIIPNQLLHKYGSLAFLIKCNFATNTHDLDEMLSYWCDFKYSTDIHPKTNPKKEIVCNTVEPR